MGTEIGHGSRVVVVVVAGEECCVCLVHGFGRSGESPWKSVPLNGGGSRVSSAPSIPRAGACGNEGQVMWKHCDDAGVAEIRRGERFCASWWLIWRQRRRGTLLPHGDDAGRRRSFGSWLPDGPQRRMSGDGPGMKIG